MKRIKTQKYKLALATLLAFMLTGCGEDDTLVMVDAELPTVEEAEEEMAIPDEEAATVDTDQLPEVSMTMEDVYAANTGDALLTDSKGCLYEVTYYENGNAMTQETHYLGFDADGRYVQVLATSLGETRVLDVYNECWYVEDGSDFYTLIYPETGLARKYISYEHDNMVMMNPQTSGTENLEGVYAYEDGFIMKTIVASEDGQEPLSYEYHLNQEKQIEKVFGFDKDQSLIMQGLVTRDTTFQIASTIEALLAGQEETRIVKVSYSMDAEKTEFAYMVPATYPVRLEELRFHAFSDEECSIAWEDICDEDGKYVGQTIYLAE